VHVFSYRLEHKLERVDMLLEIPIIKIHDNSSSGFRAHRHTHKHMYIYTHTHIHTYIYIYALIGCNKRVTLTL